MYQHPPLTYYPVSPNIVSVHNFVMWFLYFCLGALYPHPFPITLNLLLSIPWDIPLVIHYIKQVYCSTNYSPHHLHHLSLYHPSIHPSISHFKWGCWPCPILWGEQHQNMLNSGFACISVLQVNASHATITDINLHTFRPLSLRLSLHSSAENRKFSDRFDTGPGMMYVSTPFEPLTVEDCSNILNSKFL